MWVKLYAENTGSIPVRLTNIEFDPAPEVLCLEKGLSTAAWVITFTPKGEVERDITSGSNAVITNFPVDYPGLFLLYPESDVISKLLEELNKVQVDPGDILDLHLLFHLTAEDVDFPGSTDIAQNLPGYPGDICFTFTPVFTQWNEP